MFPLPDSGGKILGMMCCDVLLVAKLVKGRNAAIVLRPISLLVVGDCRATKPSEQTRNGDGLASG